VPLKASVGARVGRHLEFESIRVRAGAHQEEQMNRRITSMLAGLAIASPTLAAEVTPERLINADREPQNWLMNHRTYDGQRFSPLARINRDNVKNLRLAYAVPLAGGRLLERPVQD
jgi:glucose dehydrogenase